MFTLNCVIAPISTRIPSASLLAMNARAMNPPLTKRGHGIPAQYITGHQEFWGMDLIVSPAVLIPRPETEHVVEAVLELAVGHEGPAAERRKNAAHGASRGLSPETQPAPAGRQNPTSLRVIDVGTGSGAIALALAKQADAEIHATDISPAALEIARANAARHQLTDRIHFREADLLAGFSANSLDLIVSNPPYVGESEEDQVQLEVRKFEPRNAVFAGETGLEVIECLIPQAKAALKPGGWLIMEISGTIADQVRELLADWNEVAIEPDLQSIPRVAKARKSQPQIHTDQHGEYRNQDKEKPDKGYPWHGAEDGFE